MIQNELIGQMYKDGKHYHPRIFLNNIFHFQIAKLQLDILLDLQMRIKELTNEKERNACLTSIL